MGVSIAREEDPAASRRLLEARTVRLKQDRLKCLFVTTVHPDDPYEPYRRTRAFYERQGFELVPSRGPLAYDLKPL